ncbi:MAG: extracellular solute-binding protein [Oscillospiraceae bacterium]|nr:extracellular solute-binding protein [Oscillospiraceae bacterium]
MKRTLAIALALMLALFALAGCGTDTDSGSSSNSGNSSNSGSSTTDSGSSTADSGTSTDSGTAANDGETVDLLVWGPQEDQEFLAVVAERFKAANPQNTYNFTFGVVKEDEVKSRLGEDITSGADVFRLPDDQMRDLVNSGSLYEITRNADNVKSRNAQSSVEGAILGGKLMGYPSAADNGYYLYYDKSVLSDEDVKTLDAILEKSAAAGKKLVYPITIGWVGYSWLLAQGTFEFDGDGKLTDCDFNNADGVAAIEAAVAMVAHSAFLNGDFDQVSSGLGDTVAAGVGGGWMADAIQEKLGDNYGVTKLPTATMGGKQVQLSSWAGGKIVGVNSHTQVPVHAMDFADFLTSEEMQQLAFEMRQTGPSNINVANSDALKGVPHLAALAYQAQFAQVQAKMSDPYWSPVEALMQEINAGLTGDVQSALNAVVEQLFLANG